MTTDKTRIAAYWARVYQRKYNDGRIEFDDLFQEAQLALWKCEATFDESKGCFFSWASGAIRFALTHYCSSIWKPIKHETATDAIPEEAVMEASYSVVEAESILASIMRHSKKCDAEVLNMRLEGKRWRDIARATGKSERRIRYAKERLMATARRLSAS